MSEIEILKYQVAMYCWIFDKQIEVINLGINRSISYQKMDELLHYSYGLLDQLKDDKLD